MKSKIFKMRNVVAVAICLAGVTMFSGCDPNKVSRTLTAEEQKLVGRYSYNTSGSGYWAYFNSGYDYWKDSWGSFAEGLWFKPDGTFNGVVFGYGSAFIKGGAICKTTGKWSIPREGIILFADMVENTEYADGSKSVWRQSEHPNYDPEMKYEFKQQDDGTQGIMYGDKNELVYHFYTKTE